MTGWICKDCGLDFTEPLWIPEYVDDLRPIIPAYETPVCPYCRSEEIAEVIDLGEDDGEEV